MRSLDDSKEGVQRFLQRNPSTSVVAVVKEENKEKIVGAILCGHDGRRGCFYHVCVDEPVSYTHLDVYKRQVPIQ